MKRLTILLALAACGHSSGGGDAAAPPPPAEEAPVAINPEVPVAYPPALFDRGVDGEVKLRLFADSTGKLVPESTKILESSGYPAMDSAALAGAPHLKFVPGRRHGLPVATAFEQSIEFRHPSSAPVAPADVGETKPLPPPVTLSTPAPPKPKPRARPRPDSTRSDTARTAPTDTTRRDTSRTDTTKAKPDTTPPVKPDSGPKPVRPDSNDRAH